MWNFLSRLKRAQDAEARASENFGDAYESGRFTRAELLEKEAEYDSLIERNRMLEEMVSELMENEADSEGEDGEQ